MKKYTYQARDRATDKVAKSTIQADSEAGAAKALLAQGFVPLSIKEDKSGDSFFVSLWVVSPQKIKSSLRDSLLH